MVMVSGKKDQANLQNQSKILRVLSLALRVLAIFLAWAALSVGMGRCVNIPPPWGSVLGRVLSQAYITEVLSGDLNAP